MFCVFDDRRRRLARRTVLRVAGDRGESDGEHHQPPQRSDQHACTSLRGVGKSERYRFQAHSPHRTLRSSFVSDAPSDFESSEGPVAIPDKRTTEADAVGELRSGMTIGIGGWGSRRKPMSLVRELLRSDVDDLTVVSYGGPDVGLLCRAGKVRKVVSGFVSLDSIPLEPHYRLARQQATIEVNEWDEGMLLLGLQAAAWRVAVPADPCRSRQRSSPAPAGAPHRHLALSVVRRWQRGAPRRAGAAVRRRVHPHAPGRPWRQRPVPEQRPLHGRPDGDGGRAHLHELRADHRNRGLPASRLAPHPAHLPADDDRGDRAAAAPPTSPSARPTTPATRPSRRSTPPRRRARRPGTRSRPSTSTCPRRTTRRWWG